jgi:hypothetical protein
VRHLSFARLSRLLMFGAIAISIGGRRRRRFECGVDFCLNPASGHGLQPRLGFTGPDDLANLELPSPDIGFGGRRDAVLDALVDHRKSHSQKNREGLLSASAINPGKYGIGPAVYWTLRGPDMFTRPAFTQKRPGCSIQDFQCGRLLSFGRPMPAQAFAGGEAAEAFAPGSLVSTGGTNPGRPHLHRLHFFLGVRLTAVRGS